MEIPLSAERSSRKNKVFYGKIYLVSYTNDSLFLDNPTAPILYAEVTEERQKLPLKDNIWKTESGDYYFSCKQLAIVVHGQWDGVNTTMPLKRIHVDPSVNVKGEKLAEFENFDEFIEILKELGKGLPRPRPE